MSRFRHAHRLMNAGFTKSALKCPYCRKGPTLELGGEWWCSRCASHNLAQKHRESAERDERLSVAGELRGDGTPVAAYLHFRQRALAAEARVTELEAALTKIADGTILSTRFREIAAAALAKEDTDE